MQKPRLKKQILLDLLENLPSLAEKGISVEDYAKDLISEDGSLLTDIPDGELSKENHQRLHEVENRLEKEWWEGICNGLLVELLGHWKPQPPKKEDDLLHL